VATEVRQHFRSGYAQTVRLALINESTVGSFAGSVIDVLAHIGTLDKGRELVTRFSTDLDNGGAGHGPVVYTDASGLEFQRRTLNLTYYGADPVAGNYYPITQATFIRDEAARAPNAMPAPASTSTAEASSLRGAAAAAAAGGNGGSRRQLMLLTDRAHGAASLRGGQLEVMLQRRCLKDDRKGVGEVLNETAPISPQQGLLLDTAERAARLSRRLSLERYFPPTVLFGGAESAAAWRAGAATLWAGGLLAHGVALPEQIHLMSFERTYGPGRGLLVRLQHLFAAGEHPVLSQPVTLDLATLFNRALLPGQNFTEMTLSALLPAAKAAEQRLQWKVEGEAGEEAGAARAVPLQGTTVTVSAREIRTFVVS
jgi:hypothetical protein